MAEFQGGMGGRAVHQIDRNFQNEQHSLSLEHRRQEQRLLAFHKGQLQSFADNREAAGLRYAQRLRTIEEKRDRIADAMHRQHKSVGGRLQAMTKAGRARQAGQLERLDDRARLLQKQAHRNFQALTERQFHAEQRDRISRARELKLFRQDHQDARQEQTKRHEQLRPQKVEKHDHHMKRAAAELAWEHQVQKQERGQALKR